MTSGALRIQALLIQAVGQVYQAATASSLVSAAMETSGTGGLLQSPVPTHGIVNCSASSTLSSETTSIETSAFLLVASGMIKVCVHQIIVSDI